MTVQFPRLRALTLFAITLSSVAFGVRAGIPFCRQRFAISKLEQSGGRFKWEHQPMRWLPAWFNVENIPVLGTATCLSFSPHSPITDDDLRYVCQFEHLKDLSLAGTKITSGGLS